MSAASVDTVVVGAGIAGLAYAHGRGAADLVVVEAADRVGGLIRTAKFDDLHFECGPEALQSGSEPTQALVRDLGLEPVVAATEAKSRYILTARHGLVPVPMGPGDALRSPLLSWRGKLRALSEPFRAKGVALDGSVADFVRHRLGDEVLTGLVDPAVAGIYATDPEQLSLRSAFPTLHALARDHGSLLAGARAAMRRRREQGGPRPDRGLFTVAGGMESIPRAIARRLGDRLVLRCPVRAVRRSGDRWHVASERGDWTAKRVVVATTAAVAADLLAEELSEVSQQLARVTSETVVSIAHVWRRGDVSHPLDGFGYLVPSASGLDHLGTLFSSSIQPGRCPDGSVVLRTLVGGARRPQAADWDDDRLASIVTGEVAEILGLGRGSDGDGAPRRLHVSRWRAALPRYDLTHPERQDRIDAALTGQPGLSIVGNHRRGISVNALIETSTELAAEHDAE